MKTLMVRVKRSPADLALTQSLRTLSEARDLVRHTTPNRETRMTVFRMLAGVQASCEILKLALRDNK